MADNYLEKRLEAYKKQSGLQKKRLQSTLSQLLKKNRSYRAYDSSFVVRADQLSRIIDVNTKIASARNQQVLRYRPVLADEAYKILQYIRLGSALPNMHLPEKGSEPNAFIVVCSTVPENRNVSIDLGISLQSMLLQAVEMGLNGICIGAFDKEAVKRELSLQLEPLMLLAIGKGSEHIELTDIRFGDSQSYYREEGVHYVPKIVLEDLIIKK
ncbi:MAG: nitroreductase family protein [Bacteroidaceae bacterium]|nr:nitroreductase family protein [Bacteroidaceae bacterium]